MRRLSSFLLKAAISAALLYLSLRQVDLASTARRLGAIDARWFIAASGIVCVQLVLLAIRWRDIAAVCGTAMPVRVALRFTFIGLFFNQVLPSTVGGDAVRIWLLARDGAGWVKAVYSVLLDRVVGVAALALLVVICLPWTLDLVHDRLARTTLVLIGTSALAGASIFLALASPRLRIMERFWLTRHLAAASRLGRQLCRANANSAWIAVLSIAIHLLTAVAAYCAARAAGATVDFVQILLLVLPVILIATIPISIAGWGVRESTMVLAFTYAGLAGNDGLLISILFGAATFAVGAIGGIVWVASGYKWSTMREISA